MVQTTLKRRALRLFQVAFAIGFLLLLSRIVGGEEALRLLAEAEHGWLMASFGALTLQTVLSALRWKLTASRLGIFLTRREAVREYYLAQIINQALPGGVLGDAGRAVRARAQAGLMTSGQAVILERLAGQVALFAVMVVTMGVSGAIPGGLVWPGWLWAVVGLLGAAVLLLITALAVIARTSAGRLAVGIISASQSAQAAFFPPSVRWVQIGLSLATALLNVAGFTFAAWAIGADLSVLSALALVPMILLAMLIPLTIAGWGVREGAAVALFPLVGVAAVEGLAASVAFGLVYLAAALPGLAFAGKSRSTARPGDDKSARTR